MTNREFREETAVIFGNPSSMCKQHLGAKINKANQTKADDIYGGNVKTAAGFPGSFSCTSTRRWSMWSDIILNVREYSLNEA
jgi:hypothetical protein